MTFVFRLCRALSRDLLFFSLSCHCYSLLLRYRHLLLFLLLPCVPPPFWMDGRKEGGRGGGGEGGGGGGGADDGNFRGWGCGGEGGWGDDSCHRPTQLFLLLRLPVSFPPLPPSPPFLHRLESFVSVAKAQISVETKEEERSESDLGDGFHQFCSPCCSQMSKANNYKLEQSREMLFMTVAALLEKYSKASSTKMA